MRRFTFHFYAANVMTGAPIYSVISESVFEAKMTLAGLLECDIEYFNEFKMCIAELPTQEINTNVRNRDNDK